MNKKIVSFLLSLCLVMLAVFAVPVTASAADTLTEGDWEFTQKAGDATITGYNGNGENVVVPENLGKYRVVAIGDEVFKDYEDLVSISFPKTLQQIGKKTFSGCWQLTSVTLPENLTFLGQNAFEDCTFLEEIIVRSKNLTLGTNIWGEAMPFAGAGVRTDGITVTFAEGCTIVPEGMFANDGSNLVKAVFSSTVTEIGASAFENCANLQNVTLPAGLVTIGEKAFCGCSSFTAVTLPESVAEMGYYAFANCPLLKDITIHAKNLAVKDHYTGDYAPFLNAGTNTAGVTITFAQGCQVVPANICANDGSKLVKVVFADSVTSIGEAAFQGCVGLKQLSLPGAVTEIGNYAFFGCTGLIELNLPDSLVTLGNYAFAQCTGLTSVTLPAKLATLGQRAFADLNKLTSITVNSISISNISNSYGINAQPFYNCGSDTDGITVTFAEGCTRVPGNMFWLHEEGIAPNVTKVILSDTVTEIGASAFGSCATLSTVEGGTNVTTIGKYAFHYCSKLTGYTFSELLNTIGEYAFYGCASLGNVTFPSALHSIGNYAFGECQSFTSIILPEKLATLGEHAFHNCIKVTEIRIKSHGLKDPYSENEPFYCVGNATDGVVVTFERGCTRIPSYLFSSNDGGSVSANIVELNVAAGVREIGQYAFRNCSSLKKITFKGRACNFRGEYAFVGVEATVYHPGWPEEARRNYGGELTWIGYELPIIRLGGKTRFDTAIKVADEMKEQLGVDKFDAVIIASGNDFADALAGSYLATVKNAPILLTWNGDSRFNYLNNNVADYVKENLAADGTVYILGGTAAVPGSVDALLDGYQIVRLAGANRFETNLMILETAGVEDGSEILVCTSTNFADSLSASATAKPILLVFNEYGKLYGKQPEFLAALKEKRCTFTVIGGENAVSFKLETALSKYGITTRLAGTNRFETSVKVAEKYFDAPTSVVLAYAWNYPDGLCGGALAYSVDAPLILTMNKYEGVAAEYAQGQDVNTGFVLGSSELISDNTVRTIFSLKADHQITAK